MICMCLSWTPSEHVTNGMDEETICHRSFQGLGSSASAEEPPPSRCSSLGAGLARNDRLFHHAIYWRSLFFFLLARRGSRWAFTARGWGSSIPPLRPGRVSSGTNSFRCRSLRGWIPRRMEMTAHSLHSRPPGDDHLGRIQSRGHHHSQPRINSTRVQGSFFDSGQNQALSAAQGPAAMNDFRSGIPLHSHPGRLTPLLSSLCSGYDYSWTPFFFGLFWLCVWTG